MNEIANWALNLAQLRGATYVDARVISHRSRALSTKNGKVGGAEDSETLGMGIRVIANGAWGFAATDNLARPSVEAAAALAVEVAIASARVQVEPLQLTQDKSVVAEWTTPHRIDPFTTSIEENLALLLKVDAELHSVSGVTLTEANMNFDRIEQWFVSSEGAQVRQTKFATGAGCAAYAFAGNEIQKSAANTNLKATNSLKSSSS